MAPRFPQVLALDGISRKVIGDLTAGWPVPDLWLPLHVRPALVRAGDKPSSHGVYSQMFSSKFCLSKNKNKLLKECKWNIVSPVYTTQGQDKLFMYIYNQDSVSKKEELKNVTVE